jgi:GT2 family glycosyltransferase
MKSIDIVIVNWNSGLQLYNCINSIFEFGSPYVDKVIVVDNGSIDNSIEKIKCNKSINLILAGVNLGFARACNMGAQLSSAEFILFLNPDAALHKDTLRIVMDFMSKERNNTVGICGVKLYDENEVTCTSAAHFPTLKILTANIFALNRLMPGFFKPHLIPVDELYESKVVDQVIGAFFLIRRFVFDLCKGFDEQFFVYFEEVDLALRAKNLGYSSYFLANATAFHKGGGCSENVKMARLFYSLRSRIFYAKKNYSTLSYFGLLLLTAIELPIRLIQSAFRLSWIDMFNTLNAYKNLGIFFLMRKK